jgi:hypothetical protein
MSVRTEAATALQAQLGETFDVRDDEELRDKPSKSVLTVRLVDYESLPNAQGSMRVNLRLTLISSLTDASKADDELEGTIGAEGEDIPGTLAVVLEAIHDCGLVWTRSTRSLVKDTYIGHAIDAWRPAPTPY